MRRVGLFLALVIAGETAASADDRLLAVRFDGGLGACYAPAEPFPYKLSKSDPLYETARDEHQDYLEALEDYVNCLELERRDALEALRSSFALFQTNFGRDAVLRYGQERQAAGE